MCGSVSCWSIWVLAHVSLFNPVSKSFVRKTVFAKKKADFSCTEDQVMTPSDAYNHGGKIGRKMSTTKITEKVSVRKITHCFTLRVTTHSWKVWSWNGKPNQGDVGVSASPQPSPSTLYRLVLLHPVGLLWGYTQKKDPRSYSHHFQSEKKFLRSFQGDWRDSDTGMLK